MLPKYHARLSRYISGFFPASFRVEVTLIIDVTEAVAIDIVPPQGG